MSFIIFPQADNKLAVIIPTGDVQDAVKDVPAETPYAIVDSLDDVDNDYFDGFVYEDGAAVADIAACKSIHLDKFRAARGPKLQALDIAFMKAVETYNAGEQAAIAAQKQALRDVTQTELPDTLEEIKAVWPEILRDESEPVVLPQEVAPEVTPEVEETETGVETETIN